MTIGQKQLSLAGFADVTALGTRPVYGRDWCGTPTLTGPTKHGKWFKAKTPHGETVLILRQSANIWHAFFTFEGTASGSSAEQCTHGGLGDAIGTDSELKTYSRLVSKAPNKWTDEFHGLLAAKRQVYA